MAPRRLKRLNLRFITERGISEPASVLNLGTQLGLIVKSGAWFLLSRGSISDKGDNARLYLMANPEIMEEVKQQVFKTYGLGEYEEVPDEEPAGRGKKNCVTVNGMRMISFGGAVF